jgi:hypothetical protein
VVLVDFRHFFFFGRRHVLDKPFFGEFESSLLLSLDFFEFLLLFLNREKVTSYWRKFWRVDLI